MDREASSAAPGPAFVPVVVNTEEMNDIVAMLSSMERDLDGTENLVRQGRVKRSTSRHAQARRRRTDNASADAHVATSAAVSANVSVDNINNNNSLLSSSENMLESILARSHHLPQ